MLEELGIQEKDTLLVLNKADRVEEAHVLHALEQRYPGAVKLSAYTGEGLDRLATAVSETLSEHFLDVEVEFDVGDGRTLAYLSRHAEVLSRAYSNERATVHCRIPRARLHPLEVDGVTIRPHQASPSNSVMSNGDTSNGATPLRVELPQDSSIDEVA